VRSRDDARLSLWLPCFSVLLWLTLVAKPIAYYFFSSLVQVEGQRQAGLGNGRVVLPSLFTRAIYDEGYRHGAVVNAVNIPGVFTELIVSLPLSFPESFHPAGVPLVGWRTLVISFYCLPFWWFAGFGAEGLLRFRVLRWRSLLPGTIVAVLFLALLVGFAFGMTPAERAESDPWMESNSWILWGFGLWVLLFSAFPASWIRNRGRKAAE
jgi:hypothetical protein